MSRNTAVTSVLFTCLATLGLAFAQHPLVGTYLEHQIGFAVAFEQDASGQLTGTLYGSGAPMPLSIQADQQTARGWFMLEGQPTGFSAQLQADGTTLLIWFYGLDANGQPVPGTEEHYTSTRQQVNLPPSAPPPVPQSPSAQPPFDSTPPLMGTPPLQQPPAAGLPLTATPVPPATDRPAAPGAADPSGAAQLAGSWYGQVSIGGIDFAFTTVFNADGSYREEGYVDGVQTSWYAGTWTLGPDSRLSRTVTDLSPQFCMRGECTPNTNSGTTWSQLQFIGPDTVMLTEEIPPTEQRPPFQILLIRNQPGQQPPAGNSWLPGRWPVYVMPGYQVPAGPGPGQPAGSSYYGPAGNWDVNADPTRTADFIQTVIWGEADYTNPNTGETHSLPFAPDPGWEYSSADGNPLTYDETIDTWYDGGAPLESW